MAVALARRRGEHSEDGGPSLRPQPGGQGHPIPPSSQHVIFLMIAIGGVLLALLLLQINGLSRRSAVDFAPTTRLAEALHVIRVSPPYGNPDLSSPPLLYAVTGGDRERRSVYGVTFSPRGDLLAASSYGLHVYRAGSFGKVWSDTANRTTGDPSFSPDGALIAAGLDDNSVTLWDAATGQRVRSLAGHSGWVFSTAWSPDGALLASGSYDGTVIIWDAQTGQLLRTLRRHQAWVSGVVFSPDGSLLASAGGDDRVILWDVQTGEQRHVFGGAGGWVYTVVFSPDGTQLAAGLTEGAIILWDVESGRLIRALDGGGRSLAWSPDGALLAAGNPNGLVILWDAVTGQPVRALRGQEGWIRGLAFSPDGTQLASGASDGTLAIWQVVS